MELVHRRKRQMEPALVKEEEETFLGEQNAMNATLVTQDPGVKNVHLVTTLI